MHASPAPVSPCISAPVNPCIPAPVSPCIPAPVFPCIPARKSVANIELNKGPGATDGTNHSKIQSGNRDLA